jgi:hypothetical protein
MVRHLKNNHAGAAHQYAPQEQYNDFHDGDTDEEIEMEPGPMVVPNLIMVFDDDEDHVWFEDRWMVASLCDE